MIKLGISALYHNSAACIVKNNVVLAAFEEERFSGIKQDSAFPIRVIKWCLREANIKISEVDEVHWYEDPKVKEDRILKTFNKRFFRTLASRIQYNNLKKSPELLLQKLGFKGKIVFHSHHYGHSAFSYFTSSFKESAILTIDGKGEWETITISKGEGNNISKLYSVNFPNSLGMLYSTITSFLGFKPNEGEYKVMSLAPYGDSNKYFEKLSQVLKSDTEDLYLYQKYFAWEYSEQSMFNKKLCQLLELPPRLPGDTLTQDHKDLAAALQKLYEQEFYKLVKKAKDLTGSENICLGGSCAYNGVANVLAYKEFKSVFTPFSPSDAGTAIGVCLSEHTKVTPFLGPEYSNFYIKATLRGYEDRLIYFKLSDDSLIKKTAELLNNQKIVAWFQGRSEFGARALGNRSILASPRDPRMKGKLNNVIKREEDFNPFSPSVIESKASLFFDIKDPVPYMNQNVKVKVNFLPSVTHIDDTCRIQTVSKDFNIRYYKLLEEVGRVTNIPVLLNTAFNLEDETVTVSPKQAIERFLRSKIDFLVIGNFIVKKI